MGIDRESDIEASLQIGPTSEGRVRLYVYGDGFEIPMDFEPEEAEDIAEELRAAAERARAASSPGGSGSRGKGSSGKGQGGAAPGGSKQDGPKQDRRRNQRRR